MIVRCVTPYLDGRRRCASSVGEVSRGSWGMTGPPLLAEIRMEKQHLVILYVSGENSADFFSFFMVK